MNKLLISTSFTLLLISFTAGAFADECQKEPAVTAGQTKEVYVDADMMKMHVSMDGSGFPLAAVEFDIIFGTTPDPEYPTNGNAGTYYVLDKDGCVLQSDGATDKGVTFVLNSVGVERHKQ